jgi:hypothetical protein
VIRAVLAVIELAGMADAQAQRMAALGLPD